ncbi:hypothetical protein G5B40_04230 [Pikeienuella piscinae]|uniref:Uncharacterized protein n=1 Tax=Pikeienuella piscinae TaxID=2748098 RepID=A0A7L5BV96_9RHOB|nr:DUF6522 family protein [Pikeienuella piscinae]QIE54718.1 hypothetical protein G5B40_04230 [Pikeienuella piscinae]
MMRIMLSDDRTEVDLDKLAAAFSISRRELEDGIRLGSISSWFERGGSGGDRPRMVFHSAATGARVTFDQVGNIVAVTEAGT